MIDWELELPFDGTDAGSVDDPAHEDGVVVIDEVVVVAQSGVPVVAVPG